MMQAQGKRDWALPEGFKIQFEGEQAELFVGGVYVRLFLKNPQFPLRHPKVCFLCYAIGLESWAWGSSQKDMRATFPAWPSALRRPMI